ncbi:glutathione hydrolase 6 isoform X3 [Microtus pennsylvanicus]|uniref:glutathione hydrolase 6 isoform X3 n=1 Tax=Microtus pennsylvanicus TaxID=10058 RepID=UPI003F6C3592
MEATTGPVLYHKLQPWEPGTESEEEEEEEIAEPLVLSLRRSQNTPRWHVLGPLLQQLLRKLNCPDSRPSTNPGPGLGAAHGSACPSFASHTLRPPDLATAVGQAHQAGSRGL